jgi:hypothetical protein
MTKFIGVLLTALLGACAVSTPKPQASAPEVSATCDSFSFQRGTPAYAQCADEVDQAYWRAARSRSRVNCTPMGNQTVCQ